MDEQRALLELNERFIRACRTGDWDLLRPILSPSFVELNGSTGAVVGIDEYAADLAAHPMPLLEIDEIHVHVDGRTAVVSARTRWGAEDQEGRYADTYARNGDSWTCAYAAIWRIPRPAPTG